MKKKFEFGTFSVLAKFAGIVFLLQTIFIAMFFSDLRKYFEHLVKNQAKLVPGTKFFDSWTNPPVIPRLKIFVFNVTNHDQFLLGREKIRIQEIGPFTYAAKRENEVQNFSQDFERVTFRTRANYSFLRKESVMDEDSLLILPNTVFLSGMLNDKVRHQPDFIKRNIVWPILTSTGFTKEDAFIEMSLQQFLWNHQNELACLSTSPEEDEFQDDDFFDMNTDPEDWLQAAVEEMKPKKERNFRRAEDGKCVFGALADKRGKYGDSIEIHTGLSDSHERGKIVTIDSHTNLGVWKKNSECDMFAGKVDPTSFFGPPASNASAFSMFMEVICRPITMLQGETVQNSGINVVKYYASRDSFNIDRSRSCFSNSENLPNGALMIRSCTQGSPMAVSFPRFLYGNSWYSENIKGLLKGNDDDHLLFAELIPSLGLFAIKIRFQLNIVLTKDISFEPLRDLQPGLHVIPMFWAEEGFSQPDEQSVLLIKLALALPVILCCILISVSCILSLTFFCISSRKSKVIRLCELLRDNQGKREEPINLKSIQSHYFIKNKEDPLLAHPLQKSVEI